mgnify:CR=1 FL=1
MTFALRNLMEFFSLTFFYEKIFTFNIFQYVKPFVFIYQIVNNVPLAFIWLIARLSTILF